MLEGLRLSAWLQRRLRYARLVGGERAIVLPNWPQPTVVAEPEIRATEHELFLKYLSRDQQTVIVRFPRCGYVLFGHPNDEALGGHPLAAKGLQFYSVHEVQKSSLIEMLERRNSVHLKHESAIFRDMKHYVFTFQDSTLECAVWERESSKPEIRTFASAEEANQAWREVTQSV